MRFLLIFFIFLDLTLYASNSYYEKNLQILEELDIETSILRDKNFAKKLNFYKNIYSKDKTFSSNTEYSKLFIPVVKNMLYEANIPTSILYLAMAESLFKSRARSQKRATGVWQFMKGTARAYGLTVNEYIDERRDIVKSTQAAIKYIKKLHDRFGKWYLVIIAYNSGANRLSKDIKRAGSDSLSVLSNEYYNYIPIESINHVAKIVTLATLANDHEFLKKKSLSFLANRGYSNTLVKVEVVRGDSLTRVAKILKMDRENLVSLNEQLRYDFIPYQYGKYKISIPYSKLADFNMNYTPIDPKKAYFLHIVKAHDTLIGIGKKYHISYKLIKEFNHIGDKQYLSLNQKLYIPSIIKKNLYLSNSNKVFYRVKSGDNLSSIATKFKIRVYDLIKLNSLKNKNNLKIGDKLVVYE